MNELSTDPVKGLNNYQAGYLSTNTVAQNLALINGPGVQQYVNRVASNEIKSAFVPAELTALNSQLRADFGEFITNLYLHDLSVVDPSGNLKTLISTILGGGSTSLANYESVIRETVSPAVFLGLGVVDYSEVEEAARRLGW